ncbi:hypothetical protein J0X15_10885 [Roseibium sp. CAU 1637]|uniref:Uncharacterized protein n=1 Tax=Roseibium limicola TaxID=2816037 RepID=A0A939ERF3_9HYPH|nr:hypothetical protein [Roseibium limicola]MBO0345724.1 hypothetical protein [Roseibium limicola]
MTSRELTLADKKILLGFLKKICGSQGFSSSPRLREFLTYVVGETLAGRADMIFGKTIADDVYKRPPSSSVDSSSLVRVDAGRLRRALEAYYAGEGAEDGVRFHIDTGQYAVRFEYLLETPTEQLVGRRKVLAAGLAVLGVLVAGVVGGIVFLNSGEPVTQKNTQRTGLSSAQRAALLNRSPRALEALDLAIQARGLIFPATNPSRLIAAKGMFERAIKLSPTYYGGHAGLAQICGLQTFFMPLGEERDAIMSLGYKHAQIALAHGPTSTWAQSSFGWMEFVRGNIEEARSFSGRALEIDPADLDVLDFDSLINFFSGDFEHVFRTADPEKFDTQSLKRHVFMVTYAASIFHLGDEEKAIAALNNSAARGGPISPIGSAYLIAAHQKAGDVALARSLTQEFETTWPNSQLEAIVRRLFVDVENADTLFDTLKAAGWHATGPLPATGSEP